MRLQNVWWCKPQSQSEPKSQSAYDACGGDHDLLEGLRKESREIFGGVLNPYLQALEGVTSTIADANRNMLRLFRALEWTFEAMVRPLPSPLRSKDRAHVP